MSEARLTSGINRRGRHTLLPANTPTLPAIRRVCICRPSDQQFVYRDPCCGAHGEVDLTVQVALAGKHK